MKSLFVEREIKYTGEQLRSLWAFRELDVQGDSIVAFMGPCDVATSRLVDVADAKANAPIWSERMLHFIVEHFDMSLERAILRQRLLVSLIADTLNEAKGAFLVRRRGDDLFSDDRKLSVSIATLSPVSCLIHVGVNISSKNTPVPTRGLADLGVDARRLAEAVLRAYVQECESAQQARCKVRGVP